MSTKWIIMSAPMVRAIKGCTKTQTRRVKRKSKPLYQKGDILLVREPTYRGEEGEARYTADLAPVLSAGKPVEWRSPRTGLPYRRGWLPSRFMPLAWSRMALRVCGVELRRLQEITPGEALAEGLVSLPYWQPDLDPRETFATLWDSLHPRPPYRWRDDPWVWVVHFEPIWMAHMAVTK